MSADDRRALLDEILARPDDDMPRLIFADWLEERGDPRGEFIRTQCELSQIDELDPRWLDLQHRAQELLDQHQGEWAAELEQDARKIEFVRGFIDTLTMTARAFIKRSEALFQESPVRWIRFNYLKGAGRQLSEQASLRRLRRLDLLNLKIPQEDLLALLRSPHLSSLEGLKIGSYESELSRELGAALAHSPSARTLTHLDVHAGASFSDYVAGLAEAGELPRLRELTIMPSLEFPRGFERLSLPALESLTVSRLGGADGLPGVDSFPLSRLKTLDLSRIVVTPGDIENLARAGAFEQVERLRLKNIALGESPLTALLRGEQLRNCREFDMIDEFRRPERGLDAIEALADHAPLRGLERLGISYLGAGQLRLLASSPHLQQLVDLQVESSELSRADLRALREHPLSQNLRRLRLVSCSIAPDALEELAQGSFPRLLTLYLGNDIGWFDGRHDIEQALIAVLRSSALPSLQSLLVPHCDLTTSTLEVLAQHSNVPELRTLRFDGNDGSNDTMIQVLESDRLPLLRKFTLVGCRGLRRSDKLRERFAPRLKF